MLLPNRVNCISQYTADEVTVAPGGIGRYQSQRDAKNNAAFVPSRHEAVAARIRGNPMAIKGAAAKISIMC